MLSTKSSLKFLSLLIGAFFLCTTLQSDAWAERQGSPMSSCLGGNCKKSKHKSTLPKKIKTKSNWNKQKKKLKPKKKKKKAVVPAKKQKKAKVKTKPKPKPRKPSGFCPQYEATIAKHVESQWDTLSARGIPSLRGCSKEGYVKFFSNLAFVESTCSNTVIHYKYKCGKRFSNTKRKGCKIFNPTVGVGLFASEDPRWSKENRDQIAGRGAFCKALLGGLPESATSAEAQTACAVSIVAKSGSRYFGSIRSGKVGTLCLK